jgi:hypothetical protein
MGDVRRIVLGAFAVALVVLVTAVAFVFANRDDGDETARPESEVAQARQSVYRIKDAETAVPGDDYEVVRKIPGPIAYKTQLLLDDGVLVLVHDHRYSHATGVSLPDLVQLWDPATDRRETVPIRWPGQIEAVTATSADDVWVSFTRRGPSGKLRQIMLYDRTTGRSRVYTPPSVPQALRNHVVEPPRAAPDGRIYFLTGTDFCIRPHCRDRADRELWSFAPGSPERVRKEATDVGSYAVSRSQVAWVEPQDDFRDLSKRLSIRRHGTKQVHTTEIDDCGTDGFVPDVQASEHLVLACFRVYDDRARQVARLHIYSHGLTGITDDWIAFGWTVLEPSTGRFLQILDDRIWHDRSVVMNGDLILFPGPEGPPNARNADWTLARLGRS